MFFPPTGDSSILFQLNTLPWRKKNLSFAAVRSFQVSHGQPNLLSPGSSSELYLEALRNQGHLCYRFRHLRVGNGNHDPFVASQTVGQYDQCLLGSDGESLELQNFGGLQLRLRSDSTIPSHLLNSGHIQAGIHPAGFTHPDSSKNLPPKVWTRSKSKNFTGVKWPDTMFNVVNPKFTISRAV